MTGRKKGNSEGRVAYWRAHVAAWRKSGLSQTRYSPEHGIRQSALSYWIQFLKPPSTSTPRLLPNIVEISAATVFQAVRSDSARAPLALLIADRYQLDIRDDFHAHVLEKLIRTLERL